MDRERALQLSEMAAAAAVGPGVGLRMGLHFYAKRLFGWEGFKPHVKMIALKALNVPMWFVDVSATATSVMGDESYDLTSESPEPSTTSSTYLRDGKLTFCVAQSSLSAFPYPASTSPLCPACPSGHLQTNPSSSGRAQTRRRANPLPKLFPSPVTLSASFRSSRRFLGE